MRLAGVALLVVAACDARGVHVDPVDGGAPPLSFTFSVGWGEPPERPVPAEAPTVFIDGQARMTIQKDFSSAIEAAGETHVIELRYGDQVVRSETYVIPSDGCIHPAAGEYAATFNAGLCAYQSGDLRFGGEAGDDGSFYCIGDGACVPACFCRTSERCTSRVTSTSPFASHLGCAPIGTKQAGESCGLIPAAGGAYDDCGADLLCLEGVCRAVVLYAYHPECAFIPGHAPELRLCP